MNNESVSKRAWTIFFAEMLINFGIAAQSYVQYFMTNLLHISISGTSTIMTIGSIVAFIFIFYSGSLITNSHSKMGQYRPFILWPYLLILFAIMGMLFSYGRATIVVIAILYILFSICGNLPATGKYGLYAKMAGDDVNARNIYNSRSWAGYNASTLIYSALLLPMVYFFAGSGAEVNGWRITHLILSALTIVGIIILMRIGKPYDGPDSAHEEGAAEEPVKFGSMIRAVVKNRSALVVILADIVRYTGYMLVMYLMVYQCTAVIGNMSLMTILMTGMAAVTVVGSFLSPMLAEKMGGKKRLCMTAALISGVCLFISVFTATSSIGYAVPTIAYFFVYSFIDAICIGLYTDAGEYWLAEKHEDTRPFIMMMQNCVSALSMVITPVLMGLALTMSHYQEDVVLGSADARVLTIWTSAIPAVCMVLYAVIMLFHNKSDAEMKEYIEKNVAAGLSSKEEY